MFTFRHNSPEASAYSSVFMYILYVCVCVYGIHLEICIDKNTHIRKGRLFSFTYDVGQFFYVKCLADFQVLQINILHTL